MVTSKGTILGKTLGAASQQIITTSIYVTCPVVKAFPLSCHSNPYNSVVIYCGWGTKAGAENELPRAKQQLCGCSEIRAGRPRATGGQLEALLPQLLEPLPQLWAVPTINDPLCPLG